MSNKILELSFTGEFGWAVCSFAPIARKLSRQYDKTIITCNKSDVALYSDFAEVIPIDSVNRSLNFKKQYRPDGEFKKYGNPNPKYDILIHARGIKRKSNINYKQWNSLMERLRGYKVACIGSKEDKFVEWTTNERDIDLQLLMDYMAGAKMTIGVSSGVMHLASHCGCPIVIWGRNGHTFLHRTVSQRYNEDWNPFNSKVEFINAENWHAEPDEIIKRIDKLL